MESAAVVAVVVAAVLVAVWAPASASVLASVSRWASVSAWASAQARVSVSAPVQASGQVSVSELELVKASESARGREPGEQASVPIQGRPGSREGPARISARVLGAGCLPYSAERCS